MKSLVEWDSMQYALREVSPIDTRQLYSTRSQHGCIMRTRYWIETWYPFNAAQQRIAHKKSSMLWNDIGFSHKKNHRLKKKRTNIDSSHSFCNDSLWEKCFLGQWMPCDQHRNCRTIAGHYMPKLLSLLSTHPLTQMSFWLIWVKNPSDWATILY